MKKALLVTLLFVVFIAIGFMFFELSKTHKVSVSQTNVVIPEVSSPTPPAEINAVTTTANGLHEYHDKASGITISFSQDWQQKKDFNFLSLENEQYTDLRDVMGWPYIGDVELFIHDNPNNLSIKDWIKSSQGYPIQGNLPADRYTSYKIISEKEILETSLERPTHATANDKGIPGTGKAMTFYIKHNDKIIEIFGGTRKNPDAFLAEFQKIVETVKFDK